MRSDAAKRREALVREARRLFAAHGSDVALESIADAAGVGIATLYRNFDSRAALADEVASAILSDMQRAAAAALETIGSTPETAWLTYVHRLVELDLGALSAALADFVTSEMSGTVREAQEITLDGVEKLLAAAKSSGLVRPDLGALEFVLAIGMITRPHPEAIRAAAPNLVPQLVSIVLAGMRP
ncbi:TetR/AcrR family transcriptional regulator [Rhodococcus chondri]|uniref:Helix-turn-helix domain-containing protein n=1 Tax=Rhodococcus chondri TaxID=3065941 RepID=A0ABU7JUA3_9NOCA|nr:helix-turn-helix domain-containing protein [Rhodococcus sp. CC-R104]MEE2033430.1 helix-turn-helix domain-containing protein [Rhodococcus sp. CC-R104]